MEEMIKGLLQLNAAWWDKYYNIKSVEVVSEPLELKCLRFMRKP